MRDGRQGVSGLVLPRRQERRRLFLGLVDDLADFLLSLVDDLAGRLLGLVDDLTGRRLRLAGRWPDWDLSSP